LSVQSAIDGFLDGWPHVVVGPSRDRTKYGNKVLRCNMQQGRPVYAVNPHASAVEGLTAYPDFFALPKAVHGVSIITPPHITAAVVGEAADVGIGHLWMQPGAESGEALDRARGLGLSVIADGSCILDVLGYHD